MPTPPDRSPFNRVNDGSAIEHRLRQLTKRHRAPRLCCCRVVRPRVEDVREERRSRLASSDRESSLCSGRRSPSEATGLLIERARKVVCSSDSSAGTVPEDPRGFADWISSRTERSSRSAPTDARRRPSVRREQNALSNIHAGTTTAAPALASVQTKISSPPRLSRE